MAGGKNGEDGGKKLVGNTFIEGLYGGLGWKNIGDFLYFFLFFILYFFYFFIIFILFIFLI